jgi:hypothetical protein
MVMAMALWLLQSTMTSLVDGGGGNVVVVVNFAAVFNAVATIAPLLSTVGATMQLPCHHQPLPRS